MAKVDHIVEATTTKKVAEVDIQYLKTEAEIEAIKQKTRLEQEQLNLATNKFAFEQKQANRSDRFLNKNLGTVITAIVSLTAVLVTGGQIWITYISKNNELELLRKQKEQEMSVSADRFDKEWRLSISKFAVENSEKVFSKDSRQKAWIRSVLSENFPSDKVYSALLAADQIEASFEHSPKSSQAINKRLDELKSQYAEVWVGEPGPKEFVQEFPFEIARATITPIDNIGYLNRAEVIKYENKKVTYIVSTRNLPPDERVRLRITAFPKP